MGIVKDLLGGFFPAYWLPRYALPLWPSAAETRMRAQFIGGDVQVAQKLTVYDQRLRFVTLKTYTTIGGNPEYDTYHDVGTQHVIWGDAVVASGHQVVVWNERLWNAANAWRWSVDDRPEGQWGQPSSPLLGTMAAYCRPGLSTDGTNFYIYYIDSTKSLVRIQCGFNAGQLNVIAVSAGTNLVDGNGANMDFDSIALCPISPTTGFLLGYKAPLVWACHYTYTPGDREGWTFGRASVLLQREGLHWSDITVARAASIANHATTLTVPMGHDGQAMCVRYADDVYSTPRFMLASPGQDMGRRVWVNGLTAIGERFWAVVYNEMEGDAGERFAGHTRLLSSPDGARWTDEGYVSQLDVRGSLLSNGNMLYLASPAIYLEGKAPARVSSSPHPDLSWEITNLRALRVTHGGVNQTPELNIQLDGSITNEMYPGLQVVYELGAYVDGAPRYAKQFTGYVDRPAAEYSLGRLRHEWLARGVLGRLLGETAYRPPTSLWFPGRRAFHTAFMEQGVAAEAMAALSGYFVAEVVTPTPPEEPYGRLVCSGSGIAVVPLLWETADLFLRVRATIAKGLRLVFWAAGDDADVLATHWRVGFTASNFVLEKVVNGTAAVVETRAILPPAGEFEIGLTLSNGVLVTHIQVGGTTTRQIFSGHWDPETPRAEGVPASWRAGVYVDVNMVQHFGTGLNDMSPVYVPTTGTPATIYITKHDVQDGIDRIKWSLDNATWSEPQKMSQYGNNVGPNDDVVVKFAALTGHAIGAGEYWTLPYPQPCTYIYDVTAVGGDDPVTVVDVLETTAIVAGVATETDPATSYAAASPTPPTLREVDIELTVAADNDAVQLWGTHELVFASDRVYLEGDDQFGVGAEIVTFPMDYTYPYTLRLVANDDVVSLHRGGHVVAAWYAHMTSGPVSVSGQACFTLRPMTYPVDETWWDYNEPAAGVLGRILDRRRVYLYDDPDGVLRISLNRERNTLIGDTTPVDTHTYYGRATTRQVAVRDARGSVGLIGIVGDGAEGTRVYLLDPYAASYGASSLTQDNPWVRSGWDALIEARRTMEDIRRQLFVREVRGFWDPVARVGDVFMARDANGEIWSGVIETYEHELSIDKQLRHEAVWTAVPWSGGTGSQYVDVTSGSPQVTEGAPHYDEGKRYS